MKPVLLYLTTFLIAVQTAAADTLSHVDRWYSALRTVGRPVFQELLSADAVIDLRSLGVVQDKSEFIESLDYWEDVAGDLFISKTIVSSGNDKIELDVCYRFPSESFTNRETFYFEGLEIVRQTQEKLREDC